MRETVDVADAAKRLIRAVGRRVGQEDPSDLRALVELRNIADVALADAVDEQRRRGATDVQIGEALGVSRQAVRARWPWPVKLTGAQRRAGHGMSVRQG